MKTYVWLLNVEVLEELFRRCEYKEAITEAEREAVLLQMHKEGLVQCLGSTDLSKEELKSELSKDMNVWTPEEKKNESE